MEDLRPLLQIRKTICGRCKTKCEAFTSGTLDFGDPCISCHLRKWEGRHDCHPDFPPQRLDVDPNAITGLGDAFALVAQPIARAVDAVSGGRTDLVNCWTCKQRRKDWNEVLPFKRKKPRSE